MGVDRILREADCAKASLYSSYGSKDSLVIAYLTELDHTDRSRFALAIDGPLRPRREGVDVLRSGARQRIAARLSGLPLHERCERVPRRAIRTDRRSPPVGAHHPEWHSSRQRVDGGRRRRRDTSSCSTTVHLQRRRSSNPLSPSASPADWLTMPSPGPSPTASDTPSNHRDSITPGGVVRITTAMPRRRAFRAAICRHTCGNYIRRLPRSPRTTRSPARIRRVDRHVVAAIDRVVCLCQRWPVEVRFQRSGNYYRIWRSSTHDHLLPARPW